MDIWLGTRPGRRQNRLTELGNIWEWNISEESWKYGDMTLSYVSEVHRFIISNKWLKVNLPSERLNQSWSEHVPRLKKIFSRNVFLFLLIFWLRKSHVIWPFFLVEFWDLSQYFLSFFPLTVKPQPSHWFWNQTRRWKLKILCWNSVCRTIPI